MDSDQPPRLTYGSYLCVPELLSLQRRRSAPPHHDEMLFIIAHQVYELWFKQMLHEIEAIIAHLDRDQPLRAARLFERVHRIQALMIEQIPVLESMFAADFAAFRSSLGTSSGFQSVQFRQLEFLVGAKNPRLVALVGDDDDARRRMTTYLARPTPYDHFLRHLSREDSNIFGITPQMLARDTTQPHTIDERTIDALSLLYKEQAGPHHGERYSAQYRVAEHLLEFDEMLSIWRFHHVKMVERMIGAKMGTGGSPGAKYLRATLEHPLYPDLWAVRDRLS